MAQKTAPFRPQGDVSCIGACQPLAPWRPERNGHGLARIVRDLQWLSPRFFQRGHGIVPNNPLLVYDKLVDSDLRSNKLPVHRSPGGIRLMVRTFTTPLKCLNHPSDPSTFPCSNRESRGPNLLDGCRSIHHTRSPNCAKRRTARLPTILSYAVLPSRPTRKPAMHTNGI